MHRREKPQEKEHLFERFRQVEAARAAAFEQEQEHEEEMVG